MRLLITIISLILLATACKAPHMTRKEKKAIRKVQQSQHATDSLVRWYVKTYPQTNDTTFRPGKDTTIIRDTTIHDSVYVEVPTHYRHNTVHYKDRLVRDTVEIVDKQFALSMETRLQELEARITVVEQERDQWKHLAQIRLWIMIAVIAISVVINYFVLREKIKHKINQS